MKFLWNHFQEPNSLVVLVLVEWIQVLWVIGDGHRLAIRSTVQWLLTRRTQHHAVIQAVTTRYRTVAHFGRWLGRTGASSFLVGDLFN